MLDKYLLQPGIQKTKFVSPVILLILLCFSSAPGLSANKSEGNTLTQSVSLWGVKKCASRVNQVSQFVGYNKSSGALAMMPPTDTNERLIPVAMEVNTETGAAYVSANFAPNQVNGCGASYDAVVYWEKTCDELASHQFRAYKNIGKLNTSLTILDGGLATKVFLMPAGSGCVSIKKEIVI
jgi:hypothetical protein